MSAPLIGTLLKTVLDILFPTNCQSVSIPTDCSDVLLNNPSAASGLYMIGIGPNKTQIQVYCDMATSGGGWTVFQRRKDGSVDFGRGWDDYAHGFGTPNEEHWLGNDNLATLTAAATYKLRVDLRVNGDSPFAEFDNFKIGGASDKYRLTVGAYTAGDAGDGLAYNSGSMFTTFDQYNCDCPSNCALDWYGPWWHKCCADANLNGVYGTTIGEFEESIMWAARKYMYIPFTEMKIRRM